MNNEDKYPEIVDPDDPDWLPEDLVEEERSWADSKWMGALAMVFVGGTVLCMLALLVALTYSAVVWIVP